MADYGSVQSPQIIYKHLSSSFFTSPMLSAGFALKGCNETEPTLSPTSTLDAKPFLSPKASLSQNTHTPRTSTSEKKSLFEKFGSKGLADALIDEKSESIVSRHSRKIRFFGPNLNIQVPRVVSRYESPKTPTDFGIKTRISHVGQFSPVKSSFGSVNSGILSSLSASEMELSEDYTRVISYGPNPRTTHIFDDCVVENCCGAVKFSESRKGNVLFSDHYPSTGFLSSCDNCKKNLGQGKDFYIYRGEKAFCSSRCRNREMVLKEESMETLEAYGFYSASS